MSSTLREKLDDAISKVDPAILAEARNKDIEDSFDMAWQIVRLSLLMGDRTLRRASERDGGQVSNRDVWAAIIGVAHGCELAAEMMDRLDAKHAAEGG